RGRGAGVPGLVAVGIVGVGPFDRTRGACDEACGPGLVVVQVLDLFCRVVDLLDRKAARAVHEDTRHFTGAHSLRLWIRRLAFVDPAFGRKRRSPSDSSMGAL